jgi:hypothetical protein
MPKFCNGGGLDMDSPLGSGQESSIGENSLVMSGTGIPVGSPFPSGFGSREKIFFRGGEQG